MKLENIITKFKEEGYVNAGQAVLSKQEINELSTLCNEIYSKLLVDYENGVKNKDFLYNTKGTCGFARVPEYHHKLSELLNKVICDQNIKKILEEVLGKNYKIWQIVYRKSLVGDKGLSIHQDAFGETNLSILLSDNQSGAGSTFFLPKSHLLKKRIIDYGITIPLILLKVTSFIFIPFMGKKGDIGFFFNYTWHGRKPNNYKNSDVILFSFFPPTASIGYEDLDYSEWSKTFINNGNELSNLVNPKIGTKKRQDNRYEIIKINKSDDDPFVIKLHKSKTHTIIKNKFNLYAKIMFLYIVCNLIKPIWVIIKKIKK